MAGLSVCMGDGAATPAVAGAHCHAVAGLSACMGGGAATPAVADATPWLGLVQVWEVLQHHQQL